MPLLGSRAEGSEFPPVVLVGGGEITCLCLEFLQLLPRLSGSLNLPVIRESTRTLLRMNSMCMCVCMRHE